MGLNYSYAGFADVEAVAAAQNAGAGQQAGAFARFISRPPLLSALRRRSCQKFAAAYNGPGYASNRYDEKLEESYARFKAAEEAEAPAAARTARGKRAKPAKDVSELPPGRESFRSEEHTSELQSLMPISSAVFCLKKKKQHN